MSSFVDIVKIICKAGNGGDGAVSFHREKYVANGGPDGGDGGRGGNIILRPDEGMHTLLDFRYKRKFQAGNGENGASSLRYGKSGEDLVIRVPLGTIVRDLSDERVIADVHEPHQDIILLRGGRGGLGNSHFANAVRQAPSFAKPGERVQEHVLQLELKTIADVGLIGFPNVGKSTILSIVSAAKPKIANYHFTTLVPNLGVVRIDEDGFVLADIPGLIEGASEGAGLGHYFLRHVERTRILIHVLDISGSEGRDPLQDYDTIQNELAKYGDLKNKKQLIAANKMDIDGAKEWLELLEDKLSGQDVEIFPVSAATNEGFLPLLRRCRQLLAQLPPVDSFVSPVSVVEEAPDISSFTIIREGEGFAVDGPAVDWLGERVDLADTDSIAYFDRMLRRWGIIDALRKEGCKDGDSVRIGDITFDFVD